MLQTINVALGTTALSEKQLNEAFEVWWPKLDERLARVAEIREGPKVYRADRELLEESLELIRDLARSRIISSQPSMSMEPIHPTKNGSTFPVLRSIEDATRLLRTSFEPNAQTRFSTPEDPNELETIR